jgi:hypothetical protein
VDPASVISGGELPSSPVVTELLSGAPPAVELPPHAVSASPTAIQSVLMATSLRDPKPVTPLRDDLAIHLSPTLKNT